MGIRVTQPGLLTTIQDQGRVSGLAQGFSPSGVMDRWASTLANILVANEESAAVIEFCVIGPTLTFTRDTVVAITGGIVQATVNGEPVAENQAVVVAAQDVLQIGPLTDGRYGYIAVAGGIHVDSVLASTATSLRYHLGGFKGRALQAGDFLPINETNQSIAEIDQRKFAVEQQFTQPTVTIRVTKGPQFDQFDDLTTAAFTQQTFTISNEADRMGIRLVGEPLSVASVPEMLSEATVAGGIQVPKNGQPIVLMADRQTTGGYPVIAVIASVDLSTMAQLVPGQQVQFKVLDLAASQQLLVAKLKQFEQLQQQFAQLKTAIHRTAAAKISQLFND